MLEFDKNLSVPLKMLAATYFLIYKISKPPLLIPLTLHFILVSTIICQVGAMIFTDNLFDLTNILYVFLNVMVAFAKALGFIFHGKSVHNIFDSLNDKDVIPQVWKQDNAIPATIKHLKYVRWLFYVAGSVTCFLVIFTTDYANKKLPIGAWYPFDTIDYRVGYMIAFTHQLIFCIVITCTILSLNLVITSLMYIGAMRLKALSIEMSKLGDPNRTYADNVSALNLVVNYHIKTIKYITDIQNIFTAGIFVQCVATGITLCTTGYKMIISNDSRDVMAMASVLSFVLGEFFYFNYYGNEITFYSERLQYQLYSCNWYCIKCTCPESENCSKHRQSYARSIFIIMENVKRPHIFKSGKIFEFNYNTFVVVCKLGFRAFAVLRDMH